MCVACTEYIKDTLKLDEFRSAMREMSIEDQKHAEEVARLVQEYAGKPEELKRQLQALNRK